MKKLSGWCAHGCAALVLACCAGGASAADLGFYIVADGAATSADIPAEDLRGSIAAFIGADPETMTDLRVDTKARRYSITVGYQLGTYFAVEGSFVDFGKLRYDYQVNSGSAAQTGSLTIKPRGPTVSAVGLLPLGDYFSLDAHAGFAFIDNKYKISLEADSIGISDGKTAIYYGGGFAWWITGQVALRVGYNSFHKGVFEHDATQYTLGIRYSYGY